MNSFVTGESLLSETRLATSRLLSESGVAASTNEALQRIFQFFGLAPSVSGHNIPGITELRDEIHSMRLGVPLENALVISAPHSHWKSDLPVICSFHDGEYLIGPKTPNPKERYLPVSFLFSPRLAVAYEWADQSVGIDEVDVSRCITAVNQLNGKFGSKGYPLGISINFRFKKIFEASQFSVIENPAEYCDFGYQEMSIISRYAGAASVDIESEQVAWTSYTSHEEGLSESALLVLNFMRESLAGTGDRHAFELERLKQRLAA